MFDSGVILLILVIIGVAIAIAISFLSRWWIMQKLLLPNRIQMRKRLLSKAMWVMTIHLGFGRDYFGSCLYYVQSRAVITLVGLIESESGFNRPVGAIAAAIAVIPYCVARAVSELGRG